MERNLQPEWMDRPGLDPQMHAQALTALRRVNFLSGTAYQLVTQFPSLVPPKEKDSIKILDIGCGSGDVLLSMAEFARKNYRQVEALGLDISPFAVAQAQRLAVERKSEHVNFRVADVLQDELPADFDIVTCSLFLHHFSREDASNLIRKMAGAAQSGIIVSDLKRSRIGYWLAWIVCRLLTRSPIVHYDGPVSVAGAFSIAEIKEIADENEVRNVSVRSCWPQRWLLRWKRELN